MSHRLRAIRQGDLVRVQGHEFRVVHLTSIKPNALGDLVCEFFGEASDSPLNDSIRDTGYASGAYTVLIGGPNAAVFS